MFSKPFCGDPSVGVQYFPAHASYKVRSLRPSEFSHTVGVEHRHLLWYLLKRFVAFDAIT